MGNFFLLLRKKVEVENEGILRSLVVTESIVELSSFSFLLLS